MTPVGRTEVDGVPTFWSERPGPFTATLVFRVGQVDEALPERGVTHLIEHLALSSLGLPHLPHNGMVAGTTTTFVASGDPGEVAGFLRDATRSLADLPWHRLESEVRILRTEAGQRGTGAIANAMSMRYGATGYGVVAYPEMGLHRMDPSWAEAWRRRWFTRQNAVLWLSGPPPEGLDLSALADGERIPAPEPLLLASQPFPCWMYGPRNAVMVLVAVPTSTLSHAAIAVAGSRLRKRLRMEEGRSYTVASSVDDLSGPVSHGVLVADCLPEEAETVLSSFRSELAKLTVHGPDAAELAELVDGAERARHDPNHGVEVAELQAMDELLGRAAVSDDERLAALRAIRPEEVAAEISSMLRSAVWVVPEHVGLHDRRVHTIVDDSGFSVVGTTYTRPVPAMPRYPDRLVAGPQGLSMLWPEGQQISVNWPAAVAVQTWTDGGRTVFGADGFTLTIRPTEWTGGERIVAEIDHHVPPDRVVPMAEPLGTVEIEPAPPGSSPVAKSTALAKEVGNRLVDVLFLMPAMLFGFLAFGVAITPRQSTDGPGFLAAGVGCAAIATWTGSEFRRRRQRHRRGADGSVPKRPERTGQQRLVAIVSAVVVMVVAIGVSVAVPSLARPVLVAATVAAVILARSA